MANFVKIGHTFVNLDRVENIEDHFPIDKEDRVVLYFGRGEGESLAFIGREADDLRTWLNSVATNLHHATTDLDTAG
jgi:hypothetical protein